MRATQPGSVFPQQQHDRADFIAHLRRQFIELATKVIVQPDGPVHAIMPLDEYPFKRISRRLNDALLRTGATVEISNADVAPIFSARQTVTR
jgi:hypothetical protein